MRHVSDNAYLTAEARARVEIDRQLAECPSAQFTELAASLPLDAEGI